MMNNKIDFDICTLLDFDNSFRERFKTKFRIRNFYTSDKPDILFEFDFFPSEEMICFIKEYAKSIGGIVIFTNNHLTFEIYRESKNTESNVQ